MGAVPGSCWGQQDERNRSHLLETVLHLPSHEQVLIQAVLENKKGNKMKWSKWTTKNAKCTIQMTNN